MRSILVCALAAWCLVAACGSDPAAAPISPSASAVAAPSPAALDDPVVLPVSFPRDFPVYPGARPTEQIVLTSGQATSWEVTWQTLDNLDVVQAYYSDQLKRGDWTITIEGTTSGRYSATFKRRSDARYGGLMQIDSTVKPGVVSISVVLTNSIL